MFTADPDVAAFASAVDQVTARLRRSGLAVEQVRRAPQYARLHVGTADSLQIDVDLGVDWRQDAPVLLDVGPVLSLVDAVGNTVSALCRAVLAGQLAAASRLQLAQVAGMASTPACSGRSRGGARGGRRCCGRRSPAPRSAVR